MTRGAGEAQGERVAFEIHVIGQHARGGNIQRVVVDDIVTVVACDGVGVVDVDGGGHGIAGVFAGYRLVGETVIARKM